MADRLSSEDQHYGVHMSHCGPLNDGVCKYGQDDICPALPCCEDILMWEILVPTVSNEGKPYRLRYHKVWDKKVLDISGGLTIMKPALGQWVNPADHQLFHDRVIPVRFIGTHTQKDEIVDMTCIYYDQLAVLCYAVGEKVTMRTREEAERNQRERQRISRLQA